MSNNQPLTTISSSKVSAPAPSPLTQSQPGFVSSASVFQQRGGFALGASSRSSPVPRNNQQGKKQHKSSKRFRQTDEDAIVESLAMRPFNNRKGQTSITHLMNFSLPPRPTGYHQSHGNGRNYRRTPTWGLGSGYHAVDKARYVHANYRFIVDPRCDYRTQSTDADVHLDWNNVLQILASELSQEASCPICLDIPVAPRMAKCGHIFCLPCLIRYMHSEDDSKIPGKKARFKNCPLCFDTIYMPEARPVRWYIGQESKPPCEGDDIVLRLLVRRTGSTLAMPRDGADVLGKDEDIPWYHAAEAMDYARVMRGGEDYMMEHFDSEIDKLDQQGKEDEVMFGEDSLEWTGKAIRNIQDMKEKVKGIGNPPEEPKKPAEAKLKRAPIIYNQGPGIAPNISNNTHYILNSESGFASSLHSLQTANAEPGPQESASLSLQSERQSCDIPSTIAEARNRQQHEAHHTPSEYLFYQALPHCYLSPLDIRILKSAFGNFASFPSTILPRVEHVSTGHVVDDELRRRTRYLAHLPYGCEVSFLECDWTDTVPTEVLQRFEADIERRRKRHSDKDTKEEKARLRAERAEYAEFASARRKRCSISERFTADDFQPLTSGSLPDSVQVDITGGNTSTSPPWPARRGEGFASLASHSTSPSAPRTVWGTTAVASNSPVLAPQEFHDMDDGWLQDWEKDLLQEEEMIAQVQAISIHESDDGPKKQASGKKKKSKKITLMSTTARRGA